MLASSSRRSSVAQSAAAKSADPSSPSSSAAHSQALLVKAFGEALEFLTALVTQCYDDVPRHLIDSQHHRSTTSNNAATLSSLGVPAHTSLIAQLLCIVYLRSPPASSSASSDQLPPLCPAEVDLEALCRWCQLTELNSEESDDDESSSSVASSSASSSSSCSHEERRGGRSGTARHKTERTHTSATVNVGEFDTVADHLVFATSHRFLSTAAAAEQQPNTSNHDDGGRPSHPPLPYVRVLDVICRAHLTSMSLDHQPPAGRSESPALSLLAFVASLPTARAARHYVLHFVILPQVHYRRKGLGTFSEWHRRYKRVATNALATHFAAWRQHCHDPYIVEERRKRDLFLVGCIAALRRRRVKMRHQRADNLRLQRTYFDLWRCEGVLLSHIERRRRANTLQSCFDKIKFKQVAVIADRYYLLHLVQRTLNMWNDRLHAQRADRSVMRTCLVRMVETAKVVKFQRRHHMQKVFDAMKRKAVLSQYLRIKAVGGELIAGSNGAPTCLRLRWVDRHQLRNDHSHSAPADTNTKRLVVAKWRERLSQRTADQFRNAQCLGRAFAHLRTRITEKVKTAAMREQCARLQLLGVVRKWRRAATVALPRERRLDAICDTFHTAKVFNRWKQRLQKRQSRREADALCVTYANVTLMGKLFSKWQRRLRTAQATRQYHVQQAFHTKIACLYQWQKHYRKISKQRAEKEQIAAILCDTLTARRALLQWTAALKQRRRLLFPQAFAEAEAKMVAAASSRLLKAFGSGHGRAVTNHGMVVGSSPSSAVGLNMSEFDGSLHHNDKESSRVVAPAPMATAVIISDADLFAGANLRRVIFHGGGGGDGRKANSPSSSLSRDSPLLTADRRYLSTLASKALVQWACQWRLVRHRAMRAKAKGLSSCSGSSVGAGGVGRGGATSDVASFSSRSAPAATSAVGKNRVVVNPSGASMRPPPLTTLSGRNVRIAYVDPTSKGDHHQQQHNMSASSSGYSHVRTTVSYGRLQSSVRTVHVASARPSPFSLIHALGARGQQQQRTMAADDVDDDEYASENDSRHLDFNDAEDGGSEYDDAYHDDPNNYLHGMHHHGGTVSNNASILEVEEMYP